MHTKIEKFRYGNNLQETLSTCKFSQSVSKIKNEISISLEVDEDCANESTMIHILKKQINSLTSQLQRQNNKKDCNGLEFAKEIDEQKNTAEVLNSLESITVNERTDEVFSDNVDEMIGTLNKQENDENKESELDFSINLPETISIEDLSDNNEGKRHANCNERKNFTKSDVDIENEKLKKMLAQKENEIGIQNIEHNHNLIIIFINLQKYC